MVVLAAACGPFGGRGADCKETRIGVALPSAIDESSGVAVSPDHPGVYWTHNDAGSTLFAVDADGALLGRWPVLPRVTDWEDLAEAPCPSSATPCLYLADTGDNFEERSAVRILRVAEPDPDAPGDTLRTEVFPIRLPDGSRDVEALLVLPGERLMLVTKGRNDPVTVYRYPGPLRPDTVVLQEVQRLSDGPRILPRQVSGGAVSAKGVVALRTYESLQFYRVQSDTLVPVDGGPVNLRTLREPQGEGVALGLDGEVVLTSERGTIGSAGTLSTLRCRLAGL